MNYRRKGKILLFFQTKRKKKKIEKRKNEQNFSYISIKTKLLFYYFISRIHEFSFILKGDYTSTFFPSSNII